MWVSYVLKKNNEILPDMPFTGKELGLKLLKENKLDNVLIEPIKQVDHYNPLEKKVRISEDKLNKKKRGKYNELLNFFKIRTQLYRMLIWFARKTNLSPWMSTSSNLKTDRSL